MNFDQSYPDIRPIERRIHQRFKVLENVFICFNKYSKIIGQVKDLCASGLSCRYLSDKKLAMPAFDATLYSADLDFCVKGLTCKLISDHETRKEYATSRTSLRRCGVEFVALTEEQQTRIEHFIQRYTIRPY